MGLKITKTTSGQAIIVWSTVIETAMGGFTLDNTGFTDGNVIPAGQPMGFDESTRIAKVIKTAILYADATNVATTYQVKKGHNFVVGEYLAQVIGGKAYAITVVDTTTSALYDILTVGTTLGVALTAGAVFFQSSATGATAAAFFVTPKGLLYEETTVATNQSVSVVLRGTLYARRAPVQHTALQATMPLIIFSQSF